MSATTRKRLYSVLEMTEGRTRSGVALNAFIMALIFVNVVAVTLESVRSYQLAYAQLFWMLEVFSISVFSIEYLVRAWVSVESVHYGDGWRGRLRYVLSPMALIDLAAILPFYLGILLSVDTRILRVFRLLRIFKLSRHFAVLGVMGTVLRNEAKTLVSAIFIMFIMVVLTASGIYAVERNVQPEAFGSIPSAMWWATVTLTTVGYGDVVPVTVGGRILGVVITVLGVGMAALPAGIIASGFTSELARRRERYELAAKKVMMDGEIDRREREALARKRENLGISSADASQLLRKAVLESAGAQPGAQSAGPAVCPHCGRPLGG